MRVQHATVVEIDELVFATPPHRDDAGAEDRAALRRRDAAAQRRMMDVERRNAATDDMTPQLDDRALDFG
jgi:hypothetical protein